MMYTITLLNFVNCFYEFLSVLMPALIIIQIKALHLYDCLRANKSTSAWGVEARVPFLDKEFINIAMSIDPEWKMASIILLLNLSYSFPFQLLRSLILSYDHKPIYCYLAQWWLPAKWISKEE